MKRASPLPLHLPHLGLAVVPHCCTSTAITMVGEELEEEEGEELEEERVDESCARVFFSFSSPAADTCGRSVNSFSLFYWPLQSAGSPCRPSIFQQSCRGPYCFLKSPRGKSLGFLHW